MKKILITGSSGFAGSFLAEYLATEKDVSLSGTYLFKNSPTNLESIKDKIKLVRLDLVDGEKVIEMVSSFKPDFVYHLAALTSPKESYNDPSETMVINIKAQINLLEAIKNANLKDTRMLVVSSGEIYGQVDKKDLPLDEETMLRPTSPYSVSKITQDFLGLQYFLSYNLKIIRVRPFNHIGPRQSTAFVVSAFAKKIVEIEKNKREPVLSVGNLESARDFTDVRDMVKAYVLAIEKGKEGEVYNLGTGKSYKISEILEKLLSLSSANIKIERDENLLRPIDIPDLVCDATKFKNLTNWAPKIPIEVTLKDTLDYWRNII